LEKADQQGQGQIKGKDTVSEDQKKKLLSVFFILKKMRITFKATAFLALIKTTSEKPDYDKWAFIFKSSSKLPFGLEELQTMTEMLSDQIEGVPITIEAKKILFETEKGKPKQVCFAITFEVKLK
jgi:hypothetical protein